jgi:hypothetical protein
MGTQGKQGIRGIQGKRGKQGTPGVSNNYIDAKTFEDFCFNQHELVDILNHRMTKMEENTSVIKNDVSWTKKLLWAILSVVIVSFVTILIKSLGMN